LGVDLYHCLTGRVPHIRSNAVALLYAIVNDAPPAPSTIRSDLPEGLEDVMLKALAANPDERFQTADEMRNALLPFSVC